MALEMVDYLKEQALNPEWDRAGRVHDWRNYISERVKELWDTFSDEQKLALVEQADEHASNEHWD
jgi:hypothetical protein